MHRAINLWLSPGCMRHVVYQKVAAGCPRKKISFFIFVSVCVYVCGGDFN